MSFLRTYGTTLGPVGIPMCDDQAFALDAIFKQLPAEDQRLRKAASCRARRQRQQFLVGRNIQVQVRCNEQIKLNWPGALGKWERRSV